jgi:hypothetical protein
MPRHTGIVAARGISSYDSKRQAAMDACMLEIKESINKHLSHDDDGCYAADAPLCVDETLTVICTLLSQFQRHIAECEADEQEKQLKAIRKHWEN